MAKKLSVEEIKAVAGAAITARHAADSAKAALEADPENQELKTAYETAEAEAEKAKAEADALSQDQLLAPENKQKKIEKLRRKREFIKRDLKNLGADDEDDDEDDDDEDDLDDPDRPLTVGDLARIRAREASQTAAEMVTTTIEDPVLQKAVTEALASVVPSGDAEADFKKAVAIANIERNDKVLEEVARRPVIIQHRSGAGAPPKKQDAEFVPTEDEAKMMKGFGLTKEEVLAARAAAAPQK